MKRVTMAMAAAVSVLAARAMTDDEMAQLVAEDIAHIIRPVGKDGQAESVQALVKLAAADKSNK